MSSLKAYPGQYTIAYKGPIYRPIMLLMHPAFEEMERYSRKQCILFCSPASQPLLVWLISILRGVLCLQIYFFYWITVCCLWFLRDICSTFNKPAMGHNRREMVSSVQNVSKNLSRFHKLQIHVMKDTGGETERKPKDKGGLFKRNMLLGLRVQLSLWTTLGKLRCVI